MRSLAMVAGITLASGVGLAAAPPRQPNASELLRNIERLSVVGNVLYVAAHPDDENTRLLAYLANGRMLRTAYLSVTRGEGGQNLIGPEQGALLGLIRTQELLAARKIDGAEQFFTRARDFGYSKTSVETLAIWGRDEVLADMVWVIRSFRPDVIITRFPPDGADTHGHHTASALLAVEAFKAAADPKFHPEQLQRVGVWQARRLMWNKFFFTAKPEEDLSAFLKMDVNGFDPLLGASYGEIAAESRSMHKSQGFGAAPTRAPTPEYFQRLAGDPTRETIFDGIDASWGRVPGSKKLIQLLARAKQEFSAEAPHKAVPALLEAHAALQALPSNPWKESKLQELVNAIAACSGLWLDAIASEFSVSSGGELKVSAVALNRSPAALRLQEVRFSGGAVAKVDKPLGREAVQVERTLAVPEQKCSNPYWLEQPPGKGTFQVSDPMLIGLPEQPDALGAEFVLSAGEQILRIARPIAFKWTDPVAGERYRSIEIVPPVMINANASVLMFPDGSARPLSVRLKAGVAHAGGSLRLELPAGWTAEPASAEFNLAQKGAEEELAFQIRPPGAGRMETPSSSVQGTLRLVADLGSSQVSRGVVRIQQPHIPTQTLFPPAEVRLVRFDLKKRKSKIGYIVGAGDEVPGALRQVGYDVSLLGNEALTAEPLGQFDAIVVGVRAYNTNDRMRFHHKKLMDYVAGGGTLLVQYNTNNRLSRLTSDIGPYPFEISQDRVTDEEARVAFEAPEHPVLTKPNRLSAADFDGWVQERGLYFADKWNDRYQAVLSMSDPGEAPKKGSVLVTKYGKGAFIYTGLAFFRQLPAGVPGAYRLFANLLSYGK